MDWRNNRDVADFNRFYTEASIELLDSLARAVREASGNRKWVQIYNAGGMVSGPAAYHLGRLLRSDSIQITQAPADYWVRPPGFPGGLQCTWGSLTLHNKLFLTEQDWRSIRTKPYDPMGNIVLGRAPSAMGTAAMIRRETGMTLARGQGTWFFDLERWAFDDMTIMSAVKEAQNAGDSVIGDMTRPDPDVAIFYGERSSDYLSIPTANPYRWYVMRRGRPDWDTSGVPYDIFIQSDLTHPDLPDYKIYAFVLAQHISEQEREVIESLKKRGKTLVFFHAPGWVGAEDPAAVISEITGITVGAVGERPLEGEWVDRADDPLLDGLHGFFGDRGVLDSSYPAEQVTAPVFEVLDSSSRPLALYKDTSHIACAVKQHDGWTAVYCGVPKLPAQFLNNLAKSAGAWVAGEAYDAIYANRHMLTIHARHPGQKTIQLREPSKVVDLTTREVLHEATDRLSLDMEYGETRWFRLEPASPRIPDNKN
jgi:hypothetical protein